MAYRSMRRLCLQPRFTQSCLSSISEITLVPFPKEIAIKSISHVARTQAKTTSDFPKKHGAPYKQKGYLKSNIPNKEDDDGDEGDYDLEDDQLEGEDEDDEDEINANEDEHAFPVAKKTEKKSKFQKITDQQQEGRLRNEEITAQMVRLVYQNKEHQIVSRKEALAYARKCGLDLVQVDGGSDPPVCKVFDYNKEEYRQDQLHRELKKKKVEISRLSEVKELRFTSKTELKDMKMKVQKAKEFLEYGHRVKIVAVSKGEILTKADEIKLDEPPPKEEDTEDAPSAKISFSERRRKAEVERKEREAAFLRMKRRGVDIKKMLDQVTPLMEDFAFIEQGPKIEGTQGWIIFRHVKFGKKKASKVKLQPDSADVIKPDEPAYEHPEVQNDGSDEAREDVLVPPKEEPVENVNSMFSGILAERSTTPTTSYWFARIQEAKMSGKGPHIFGGNAAAASMTKNESVQGSGGSQALQGMSPNPKFGTQVSYQTSHGLGAQPLEAVAHSQTAKSFSPSLDSQGFSVADTPIHGPRISQMNIEGYPKPPVQGPGVQAVWSPPSTSRAFTPPVRGPGGFQDVRSPSSMARGLPPPVEGRGGIQDGHLPSSMSQEFPPSVEGPGVQDVRPPSSMGRGFLSLVQGPGGSQGVRPPPSMGRGFSAPPQQGYQLPSSSAFPSKGTLFNPTRPPSAQGGHSAQGNLSSHENSPLLDFFKSSSQSQPSSTAKFTPPSAQGASPLGYPRLSASSHNQGTERNISPLSQGTSPLGCPPKPSTSKHTQTVSPFGQGASPSGYPPQSPSSQASKESPLIDFFAAPAQASQDQKSGFSPKLGHPLPRHQVGFAAPPPQQPQSGSKAEPSANLLPSWRQSGVVVAPPSSPSLSPSPNGLSQQETPTLHSSPPWRYSPRGVQIPPPPPPPFQPSSSSGCPPQAGAASRFVPSPLGYPPQPNASVPPSGYQAYPVHPFPSSPLHRPEYQPHSSPGRPVLQQRWMPRDGRYSQSQEKIPASTEESDVQ